MAQVKVKVLIQRGETGLRLPGTLYFLADVTAEKYAELGYVSIKKDQEQPEKKQEKAVIETKEEKFKPVPKVTKGKRK